MATMQTLVNEVLTELRFGSGQDVQIHLQSGVAQTISRLYRNMMQKHVWRDYYFTTTFTTDALTGQAPTSLATVLTRFSNIIAVFEGNSTEPIPFAPVAMNPAVLRRPGLVPSGNNKVFTIYPFKARSVTLISRMYSEDDFDLADDVPFYRDILVLGAAFMLSTKAGTNDFLTRVLKEQVDDLVKTYTMNELQDSYQLNVRQGMVPDEWYTNGYNS